MSVSGKLLNGLLVLTVLIVFADRALGDEPLEPSRTYASCSPSGRFCAEMNAEERQTIVRQGDTEIWRMEGWFEDAYLADDGDHLVVGYWGLSLLPVNFSPGTVVVTFYRRGELVQKVQVSEIVHDLKSLPITGSHRLWGRTIGFDEFGRFIVRTAENRAIAFNVADGSIVDEWATPLSAD